MKHILWLVKWVLKIALFFTLFAFALNNQQDTTVHFFFGTQWQAPQVLVVLATFSIGVVVGVLGMIPRWFRQRSAGKPEPSIEHANTTVNQFPPGAPSYIDGN
jgi:uncharacterized integral membrane protein